MGACCGGIKGNSTHCTSLGLPVTPAGQDPYRHCVHNVIINFFTSLILRNSLGNCHMQKLISNSTIATCRLKEARWQWDICTALQHLTLDTFTVLHLHGDFWTVCIMVQTTFISLTACFIQEIAHIDFNWIEAIYPGLLVGPIQMLHTVLKVIAMQLVLLHISFEVPCAIGTCIKSRN